jgi:hypothetical protein
LTGWAADTEVACPAAAIAIAAAAVRNLLSVICITPLLCDNYYRDNYIKPDIAISVNSFFSRWVYWRSQVRLVMVLPLHLIFVLSSTTKENRGFPNSWVVFAVMPSIQSNMGIRVRQATCLESQRNIVLRHHAVIHRWERIVSTRRTQ